MNAWKLWSCLLDINQKQPLFIYPDYSSKFNLSRNVTILALICEKLATPLTFHICDLHGSGYLVQQRFFRVFNRNITVFKFPAHKLQIYLVFVLCSIPTQLNKFFFPTTKNILRVESHAENFCLVVRLTFAIFQWNYFYISGLMNIRQTQIVLFGNFQFRIYY